MSFFSSKPKDGPAMPRIRYCGYVKAPGGGQTSGFTSMAFSQVMNTADEAKMFVNKKINSNSARDGFGNIIGRSTGYEVAEYLGRNESKKNPGTFYHDFRLVNEDDNCRNGGRRSARKSKNNRRKSIRKRLTKKNFKKSRSRR